MKKSLAVIHSFFLLLAYLIIGILVSVLFFPSIPFISKHKRAFKCWYLLDILICTIIHNTTMQSISGHTGQRINKQKYKYTAAVIDFLAIMVGDSKNHCVRAYRYERLKSGNK